MTRIVLLGKMAAWCEPELRRRMRCAYQMTVIADPSRAAEFASEIEQAEVIVGWPLTQDIADRARSLRLLQASGAGIDGLALDRLRPNVRVANTFHHEVAIAEYVLMAMLWLSRLPAEAIRAIHLEYYRPSRFQKLEQQSRSMLRKFSASAKTVSNS